MSQCAYCFAIVDTDAYGICPQCRAKATKNSTAGRIHRAHLERHDAQRDAKQTGPVAQSDTIVYQFGQLPSDFMGWGNGR